MRTQVRATGVDEDAPPRHGRERTGDGVSPVSRSRRTSPPSTAGPSPCRHRPGLAAAVRPSTKSGRCGSDRSVNEGGTAVRTRALPARRTGRPSIRLPTRGDRRTRVQHRSAQHRSAQHRSAGPDAPAPDPGAALPGAGPAHRPARQRSRGHRLLARARRVPAQPGRDRGRPGVDVLRGPADRERRARHPPRRGPGVQGRLPPVQDHERSPRRRGWPAGTATGCRSSWPWRGSSGSPASPTSRPTGSPRSTPSAASRCCATSASSRP